MSSAQGMKQTCMVKKKKKKIQYVETSIFKEDGKGNIYDENGNEAMDIVDEKPNPFAIKQLVNLDPYLDPKVNTLPDQE